MDTRQAIAGLAALAQETRLSIFRLLVERGPDGLAAGAIAEALGLPASSLSFHLAQLGHAGLILQRRRSRSLIYSVDFAARVEAAGLAVSGRGEAHCCYAHSDKAWVADPQGLSWETFFTFGNAATYGEDREAAADAEPAKGACCDASCCPDRAA